MGEMSLSDVEKMLKAEIGQDVNERDVVGIAYAQHYAATNKEPYPEIREIFFNFYGKDRGEHIIACINLIFFSNLAGNSFDALMSKLKERVMPLSKLLPGLS